MKNIILFLILMFSFINIYSKDLDTNKFKLSIDLGCGYSLKTSQNNNKSDKFHYNNNGIGTNFRLNFVPESKLSIGLESGLLQINSIEISDISNSNNNQLSERINKNAYPFLLDFNMKINDFQLIFGIGYSYITINSISSSPDLSFQSSDWSMTYLLASNYSIKLSKIFELVPEIKYYFLTDAQHNIFSIQLNLRYSFIRW